MNLLNLFGIGRTKRYDQVSQKHPISGRVKKLDVSRPYTKTPLSKLKAKNRRKAKQIKKAA